MTVKKKIKVLQTLYDKINSHEFFMCNILEEFVDEETKKIILNELWKDRIKTKALYGYGDEHLPYVWYDMGKYNIKVRRQNINRTIKRLKAKL